MLLEHCTSDCITLDLFCCVPVVSKLHTSVNATVTKLPAAVNVTVYIGCLCLMDNCDSRLVGFHYSARAWTSVHCLSQREMLSCIA
jgi:hypothetical protein